MSADEREGAGAAWVLFNMKDAPAAPEDMASQGPPSPDDENTIDLNEPRPDSRASSITAPWPRRTPSRGDSAETEADMMEDQGYPVK